MAHALQNENHYVGRRPAWHGLGTVYGENANIPIDAAYADTGKVDVREWPIGYLNAQGAWVKTSGKLIGATEDGVNMTHKFGTVSDGYKLFTPDAWVESIAGPARGRGIETFGILNGGREVFACYDFGLTDVAGNEHRKYLFLTCHNDGKTSNGFYLTSTRVVCQNTFMAAIGKAMLEEGASMTLFHSDGIKGDTVEAAEAAFAAIERGKNPVEEALDALSRVSILPGDVDELLEKMIPGVKAPKKNRDPRSYEKRAERYEKRMADIRFARNETKRLFEGEAVGYEEPNMQGTGYGLAECLIEVTQYHLPGKESLTDQAIVFGSRRDMVERGMKALVKETLA